MSRAGYCDDFESREDYWALIRWRGAVNSALKGKRGQAFLLELREALDAMPVKELIAGELETASGQFCTLGVIGHIRGIDMENVDPYDREQVSKLFGIAEAMAAEIMFENDEGYWASFDKTDPVKRWKYMRSWVEKNIATENPADEKC